MCSPVTRVSRLWHTSASRSYTPANETPSFGTRSVLGFIADTPQKFDQACRTIFRVRSWRHTCTFSVTVDSGSGPVAQPNETQTGVITPLTYESLDTDESAWNAAGVYQRFKPAGHEGMLAPAAQWGEDVLATDSDGNPYVRRKAHLEAGLIYHERHGFRFHYLLQFESDFTNGTDTRTLTALGANTAGNPPGTAPLDFMGLGQVTHQDGPVVLSGTTVKTITLTQVKLEPERYWTYEGRYDETTGLLT